jgi:beta-carotene hydroxylase
MRERLYNGGVAVDESEPELPPLSELGEDLLDMTPLWRGAALASPFVCTALFFVLASQGSWWLALPCLAAHTFLTYASVSHDLVHGTLGLSPRANDVLLALVELLGLRSGRAYRASPHYRCSGPGRPRSGPNAGFAL